MVLNAMNLSLFSVNLYFTLAIIYYLIYVRIAFAFFFLTLRFYFTKYFTFYIYLFIHMSSLGKSIAAPKP